MKYAEITGDVSGKELTLYAYYLTISDLDRCEFTIDLGAGKWADDATEARPNAFPAFPGQQTGMHIFNKDATVILPIDVRFGGTVAAPVDSQGRSYVLRGFAFDDGGYVFATFANGSSRIMLTAEAILGATQLNGVDNFAYLEALKEAGLFFVADDTGADYGSLTNVETLYAIWTLWGIAPTFDPRGYADINDPEFGGKYHPLYSIYYNADGTIDETRTTATRVGSWNTADGNPPAGFESSQQQRMDAPVVLPSGDMMKRPGYVFAGWSTRLGATQPDEGLAYVDVDGDGVPDAPRSWAVFAEPTTLYAVWAIQEVEILFYFNDPEDLTYPPTTLATHPETWFADCVYTIFDFVPVKEGYDFLGWAVIPDTDLVDYRAGDAYSARAPMIAELPDGEGNVTYVEFNQNTLYAVWRTTPVLVRYWSLTDASPDDYVVVREEYLQLTDYFYAAYDQNKDDDPTNDYVAYYTAGWWDADFNMYYDRDDWANGVVVTIQEIVDLIEWDGESPIDMYASPDIRQIKVIYDLGSFAQDHESEDVIFLAWWDTPLTFRDLIWQAHRIVGIYDDFGNELTDETTCGDILSGAMNDPWGDEIVIHYVWEAIAYQVHYVYPNGVTTSQDVQYVEQLALPSEGAGFDYPGYEFVGWFTAADGAGQQVKDGEWFSVLQQDDQKEVLTLYAYFQPVATTTVVLAA